MKVIMIKDHPRLGLEGTVVEVADGHARNYLLPRGWAQPATAEHLRRFEENRVRKERLEARKLETARRTADKLGELSLTITAAAGDEDRLYGSVTAADVAEALRSEGFEIEKSQVKLEEPIKRLGIYTIRVEPAPDTGAEVKVWIVKE